MLEDMYARQGVMVVLLHPALQHEGTALDDFFA